LAAVGPCRSSRLCRCRRGQEGQRRQQRQGRQRCASLSLLLLLLAPALPAQSDPLGEARQLERRGRYEDAARIYRAYLETAPTDFQALLGLERIYTRLGRVEAMARHLAAAEAAAPSSEPLRELAIRVWTAAGAPDSVAAVVRRWMVAVPGDPAPYREWAFWLVQRGQMPSAREVLEEGRAALGPDALLRETAELLAFAAEWPVAADAWRRAVRGDETLAAAAVASLREAPEQDRSSVLRVLQGPGALDGDRRLAADLLLAWGRAEEAWTLLDTALPPDRGVAVIVLSQFAEQARQVRTLGGARARGYALERLATLSGNAEAERARLEAAQAFADAGDLRAAQRMLGGVALDPRGRRAGDAAATMASLVRVLADAGRAEEAEDLYHQWERSFRGEDRAMLREKLAWARVREGSLDRAERLLAGDSTIGAQAVLGWVALYRGDLAGATERFRVAGPYAQSREEATRRTAMLALIQRVTPDTVPALGAALLRLTRGDTARAVRELAASAARLPARGGRAAVLAFAGELAVEAGDYARAEAILQDAIALDGQGPSAPAAEYALAVSYARLGRNADAIRLLESLILNHPESAVVPQARRLLDQMRGRVPSS
jgi:tetratricopeptide (TPR) repeat protein